MYGLAFQRSQGTVTVTWCSTCSVISNVKDHIRHTLTDKSLIWCSMHVPSFVGALIMFLSHSKGHFCGTKLITSSLFSLYVIKFIYMNQFLTIKQLAQTAVSRQLLEYSADPFASVPREPNWPHMKVDRPGCETRASKFHKPGGRPQLDPMSWVLNSPPEVLSLEKSSVNTCSCQTAYTFQTQLSFFIQNWAIRLAKCTSLS